MWRGLKSRPDLFAQYVCSFKKSTFKKVLKEALSPDLVSFMWLSLRDHAPSAEARLRVLAGYCGAPNFQLSLSLLPTEDLRCVADMLAQAKAHAENLPADSAEEREAKDGMLVSIEQLTKTYGV